MKEEESSEADPSEERVDLSLNSLMGLNFAKTMKVLGRIGSREVVRLILVDSGASHSSLSESVVKEFGLPCDYSAKCGVQVGNGMCIKQQGVCRGVELLVQGHTVVEDFFPLELGSADAVILRVFRN